MSLLPGTPHAAAPGVRGFDTNTIISASKAADFKAQGYNFCVRYLARNAGQGSNDLSNAEALNILNAGLGLMAVQHVQSSPWASPPNAALGTTYGTNAANNAASVGLPKGINIWCDLEGITNAGTLAADVIAFCQSWYTAVNAAGYIPGLYVGANCILNGTQLYQNLSYQHYWKSLSKVPDVATRGYQIVQGPETDVLGVGIDVDVTQTDHLGGTVIWLAL